MNKLIIIAVVLIGGWYGNVLYKQNDLPFLQSSISHLVSDEQVKCTTKEGRVLYGDVPQGTICKKREEVKGSLTIVSNKLFSADKSTANKNNKGSNFKCDGRQHCSQMNSRAEAEFFISNCPNTKMDGDHDGNPCENDSRF